MLLISFTAADKEGTGTIDARVFEHCIAEVDKNVGFGKIKGTFLILHRRVLPRESLEISLLDPQSHLEIYVGNLHNRFS